MGKRIAPSEIKSVVATNIERLLARHDWSHRALARAAFLSPKSVHALLDPTSGISPTLDTVQAIASALGVSVRELVTTPRAGRSDFSA